MTETTAIAPTADTAESALFGLDDLVLPGYSTTLRFGADRWDLSPVGFAANTVPGDRVLNFDRYHNPITLDATTDVRSADTTTVSPVWLVRAKELLAILLAPARTTSICRIDAYQVRRAAASTVKGHHARLYALSVWATLEALPPDLERWDQHDLDDFLAHLATERPNPRTGVTGIDASSMRGYVSTIRLLWRLRAVVTHGGFAFEPWEGRDAADVVGADVVACRTKPIPQEQYQPLMRDSWFVIDTIGADLCAAIRRYTELVGAPRLPWWGHLNDFERPADMADTELVLVHANVATAVQGFRQVLTANPDAEFASAADLERRFGVPTQWFVNNRDLLVDYGILEPFQPPASIERCSVRGCPRNRTRTLWCATHASQWIRQGRVDPDTWSTTQTALPPAPRCAVGSCDRDAHGRFCGGHTQRWHSAGQPDPGQWANGDEAAVPVGGWHYRWSGRFPEVRTVTDHLTAWLADTDNRVPMRTEGPFAVHLKNKRGRPLVGDPVDWDLLALKLRVRKDALRSTQVRALVDAAVARGQTDIGGLVQPATIAWADGTERPWIDGIDRCLLAPLTHLCRMAAVVFIYMFSGMRDSEVQSLKKGCVEPFWGHLTLTGKEFKTFRGGQARWIVIEPVARAARLAETLTWHDDRIVVPARSGTEPVLDACPEIDGLIDTMNAAAEIGLLEPIPSGAPIRPHRFRRTFAVTARKHPWMDIALHWQFKHASHYMTQSYYALNDDVTADENHVAQELVEAAVDRLAELYTINANGDALYGHAAPRLSREFDAITANLSVEGHGSFPGETWRHAELRKRLRGSALKLHPGLALDCAFGPGGACGGIEAPNWNACRPTCANAVLDATQLEFLTQTADRVDGYLADDHVGETSRLILEAEVHDLRAAIAGHQANPTLTSTGAQK